MRNKKSDRIETILTEVVFTQCSSSRREPVYVYISNNSPDNPNELFVQVEQGDRYLVDFTINKETFNLMRTLIEGQEQGEMIPPPPTAEIDLG